MIARSRLPCRAVARLVPGYPAALPQCPHPYRTTVSTERTASMNLLNQVFGDHQHQQDFQDFVNRYQQGQPEEGYSDQDVLNRYQQVAPQLPHASLLQAAEQAFANMSPQQRTALGGMLVNGAHQMGLNIPGLPSGSAAQTGSGQGFEDPMALAQLAGSLHQRHPNLLVDLLGRGGTFSNPVAKSALAGITAMAARQFLGGGQVR